MEIEIKEAIERKRHQEILNLLSKNLDKSNNEAKLLETIVNGNTQALEKFLEKLQEINKETPQEISVETNQDLVVKELVKLANDFKTNIGELKESLNQKLQIDLEELKPYLEKEEIKKIEEWTFDIKRNSQGFIETVVAREK